ncbi:hypothetical protein FISHEDRAFT_75727 [Fistulina hepatica ATCC 64428]|uniref:BHLH domain-containing protein n=1 Tax=Fistulina hepatica ATCC 64428 TaxID=1128425 RepID=A0A0D7A8N7_9AGAR|nr:hypothetical protein FISHEDRAFT_75727 [Fistulina hepatica ATCC 64428]
MEYEPRMPQFDFDAKPNFIEATETTMGYDMNQYIHLPGSSHPSPFMAGIPRGCTISPDGLLSDLALPPVPVQDAAMEYAPMSSYVATYREQVRPYTPPDGASISPPMLISNLSAGELSSDGLELVHSAPIANYDAAVPRSARRYNPIGSPASRPSVRRRKSDKTDSDADDDDYQPLSVPVVDDKRETTRRQRIQAEQRRRDVLRQGYDKLREALPASSGKGSKVVLLDRAVEYIKTLEVQQKQLKISQEECLNELTRLRKINDGLLKGRL